MSFSEKQNLRMGFSFVFFWMFIPIIPVFVPFLLSLDLSMKEFFFLQAYFGLIVALFEVPSGYFADIYGRVPSLRLGSFLAALGFSYLCFSTEIWQLVLYETLVAIGLSLISGADLSLLYDSVQVDETTEKSHYSKIISHFFFILLLAESISAVLGGIAATYSMHLVVLFTAFFGWVPFAITFFLAEPPGKRLANENHIENFKSVMKFIIFDSPLVRLIFINMTIWSLSTFCAVWIIQKVWLDQNLDLIWFGIIWAALQMVAGLTSKITPHLESRKGVAPLLLIASISAIIGYVGLAILDSWAAVAIGVLFYVSRGLSSVLYKDALNWKMPSEFRATANSVSSLFFRGSFFIIGPLIGWSLDALGTKTTMMLLAAVFSICLLTTQLPLLKLISNTTRKKLN